jgi:hypothetical protein
MYSASRYMASMASMEVHIGNHVSTLTSLMFVSCTEESHTIPQESLEKLQGKREVLR